VLIHHVQHATTQRFHLEHPGHRRAVLEANAGGVAAGNQALDQGQRPS
jgi:hypothetical protein